VLTTKCLMVMKKKENSILVFVQFFSAYTNGKVNINTASKDVLIGLDPAIDGEFAEKIIQYRTDTDFTSVDDLIQVGGADIQ